MSFRNSFLAVFVGLFIISTMTGCASYQQGILDKPSQSPELQGNYTVNVDATYEEGETPSPQKSDEWSKALAAVFAKSDRFAESGTDISQPDVSVDAIVTRSVPDDQKPGSAGLVSFSTLYLFPAMGTEYYEIEAEVFERGQGQLGTIRLQEGINTWYGVWFLPVMTKQSPSKVFQRTRDNMAEVLVNETANRVAFAE